MSAVKRCKKCGQEKPIFEFPLCRGALRARCKPCHVADVTEWQKKNRDKTKANQVRFRDRKRATEGREKFKPMPPEVAAERIKLHKKKWRENNPEKLDAARRRWSGQNKPRIMQNTRRYQAKKRRAAPAWANTAEMARIYAEAIEATKRTGVPHEVDHIVPLTSDIVCGLHCASNLIVITQFENRAKANRFWPDMP